MAQLIREGKILRWEISEANEDYLRRAHAVCPVAAVENRYSMIARHYEALFPVLEELGVGLVAFSLMANGLLTGAYSPDSQFDKKLDCRSAMPQFQPEAYERNRELLTLVSSAAKAHHATSVQISLAWMLRKKPWIVPIPGSRKPERIRENVGVADVRLSAEEIAAIDKALDSMERFRQTQRRLQRTDGNPENGVHRNHVEPHLRESTGGRETGAGKRH